MDSDRSDRLTAKEIQNGLALAGIHIDMSAVRSFTNEFDLDQIVRCRGLSFVTLSRTSKHQDKRSRMTKMRMNIRSSLYHLSTAPPPQESICKGGGGRRE